MYLVWGSFKIGQHSLVQNTYASSKFHRVRKLTHVVYA